MPLISYTTKYVLVYLVQDAVLPPVQHSAVLETGIQCCGSLETTSALDAVGTVTIGYCTFSLHALSDLKPQVTIALLLLSIIILTFLHCQPRDHEKQKPKKVDQSPRIVVHEHDLLNLLNST